MNLDLHRIFAFGAQLIAVGLCLSGPVKLKAQTADGITKPLVKIIDILHLTAEEAASGKTARIQGVVTLYHPADRVFFVQDETAGIFVDYFDAQFQKGDQVNIEAKTAQTGHSPFIQPVNIVKTGRTTLPPPSKKTIASLSSGGGQSRYVETSGIIQRLDERSGNIEVIIADGNSRVRASWPSTDPVKESDYVDRRLTIRGIPTIDETWKPDSSGIRIRVSDKSELLFDSGTIEDPFIRSPIPLDELSLSQPLNSEGHRIHIQGTVTADRPGYLFVQTGFQAIQVLKRHPQTFSPGDLVKTVGFLKRSRTVHLLQESQCIKIGRGDLPPSSLVTGRQAASGTYGNLLVRLNATLLQPVEKELTYVDADTSTMEIQLQLRSGEFLFSASCPWPEGDESYRKWTSGSRFQLTGVCQNLSMDSEMKRAGFNIHIPSHEFITLSFVSRPKKSRFLIGFLTGSASFLGIVIVLFLLKTTSLKKRKELTGIKEANLETQWENLCKEAYDIIYTHDLGLKIISMHLMVQSRSGEDHLIRTSRSFKSFLVESFATDYLETMNRVVQTGKPERPTVNLQSSEERETTWEIILQPSPIQGETERIQGLGRHITNQIQREDAFRKSEQQLLDAIQDKKTLGKTLHDGTIQSIFAVGLQLEDCRLSIPTEIDQRGVREKIQRANDQLNKTIRGIRKLITSLDLHALQNKDFPTEIKSLLLSMEEQKEFKFRVEIDPATASGLSNFQTVQLLQITREAVTNCIQHSKADQKELRLKKIDGLTMLEILDNGIGFDPSCPGLPGYGLRNIKTRIASMGAGLEIVSKPGKGARLTIRIPNNSDS